MKIVILDGDLTNSGDISWGPISELGELSVYPVTAPEDRVKNIADADAVIINRITLNEEIFEKCPNVKYIGTLATGYNTIDVEAAKKRGIVVSNVPGYSTYAVAQSAIALLLHHTNRIAQFNGYVKGGGWTSLADKNIDDVPLIELYGKTMGIVGMGAIGHRVAQIAVAMGMKVLAYRRNPKKEWENESIKFVSMQELLENSDVVSLHCLLNDETRGMMNKQAFDSMKDGAILLNVARGALVDEQALSDVLDSGKISYAGIDVLTCEPPEKGNPLVANPKCTITPHVAWRPIETRQRLVQIVADNLKAFQDGKPQNVVNP